MLKEKISNFISHDYLDVLRGIAVLMVISIHSGFRYINSLNPDLKLKDYSDELGLIENIARFGSAGPMLFFIISGFLMTMLYNEKYEKNLFFKRRFYRILPLWILFSIFSAISSLGIGTYGSAPSANTAFGIASLLVNISFLSILFSVLWNYVPGGWSIQAEMVNYGIFHLVKKYGIRIMLLLQLLITIITFILQITNAGEAFLIPSQIVATGSFWFFLGIMLANYFKNNIKTDKIDIIIFSASGLITLFSDAPNEISQIKSLFAIIFSIIVSIIIINIKYIKYVIIQIGKYSYGIYLVHTVMLSILINIIYKYSLYADSNFINWIIIILTTATLSYLVALPLYKYIEKPFIDSARSMKKRPNSEK